MKEETINLADLSKNIHEYKVGTIVKYMHQMNAGTFSHKIETEDESKTLAVLLFARGEYADRVVKIMEEFESEMEGK